MGEPATFAAGYLLGFASACAVGAAWWWLGRAPLVDAESWLTAAEAIDPAFADRVTLTAVRPALTPGELATYYQEEWGISEEAAVVCAVRWLNEHGPDSVPPSMARRKARAAGEGGGV